MAASGLIRWFIVEISVSTMLQARDVQAINVNTEGPYRQMLKDAGMWAAGNCAHLLHSMCGHRALNKIGILTYHRVAPWTRGIPAPLHNVTPKRFCQQLVGLLNRGLIPWSLNQVLNYRRLHRPIPENVFVVTFDDGFESVYTHAWPILKKLNIPATIFLNTAYLDQVEPFPFDLWGMEWEDKVPAAHYRPLTVSQCKAMQECMLIELGAHTHTHQDFRGRPDDFRADLRVNVELLREMFGIEHPSFAFPFGSPHLKFAGGDLERAAKQSGVTCALTTQSDLVNVSSDDPFRWGRMNVFAWDTANSLSAKLAGWYSWAPNLKKSLASFSQSSACMFSMQAMHNCNLKMDI